MSTAPAPSTPGRLRISRSAAFLDNQLPVHFDIDATREPAVAAALASDKPFPSPTAKLASLDITASSDLRFATPAGPVAFTPKAGAHLTLEAADDPRSLTVASGLPGGAARYVAARWGYDIAAAAKGAVALGAGASVRFGASGQTSGDFTVVRAHRIEPGSRTALADLFESWKLPVHIASPADLEPGTWITAEVDGEIAATVGAQFGFDYSWLRTLEHAGLSGDIGLRIEAAAAVTVGFTFAGKYQVAVSRPSLNPADQAIQVRISRLDRKGWSFALNATVSVQGRNAGFLPGESDDFIAAVFGVHGAQLVEDLKTFREWTDPAVPLPRKFANFVAQIGPVADARERVQRFLADWDQLGSQSAAALMSQVRRLAPAEVDLFRKSLNTLAAGDSNAARDLIASGLSSVEFFQQPLGAWMLSSATGPLLATAFNTDAVRGIQERAKFAASILDGTVLQNLIDHAAKETGLAKIREAASLESLGPWLQDRLGPEFGNIEEVRATLHALDQKAGDLYKQALKALEKKYTASLAYAYSRTTTQTALIDATFDFTENPGLTPLLSAAIAGDFRNLLLHSTPGVRLAIASLTHGIERNSHIEINLPHYNRRTGTAAKSLASLKVAEENGRVLCYELDASDTIATRRRWESTVALSARVRSAAVRTYQTDAMSYSARFQQAFPNLTTRQFEMALAPLVSTYFTDAFGSASNPQRATLQEWIADLDKHADEVSNNGTGVLGTTLLELDVVLPGSVVAAWLDAPEEAHDKAYMRLSRAVQQTMRRLIPLCYFDNAGKYIDHSAIRGTAAAMLVYGAMPPSTSIRLDPLRLDTEEDTYWEFNDARLAERNERHAMIFNSRTRDNLAPAAEQVRQILLQSPDLRSFAADFEPGDLNHICSKAFTESGNDVLTRQLLFSEAEAIRACIGAGRRFARFRRESANRPDEALEALAEAGEKLTAAFNSHLQGVLFGGSAFRQLASMVFLEASRALDRTLAAKPAARMNVIVLKGGAPEQAIADFLDDKPVDRALVALEQPIVSGI